MPQLILVHAPNICIKRFFLLLINVTESRERRYLHSRARICRGAQKSIPRLAESIPRNRFLNSINVYEYGLSPSPQMSYSAIYCTSAVLGTICGGDWSKMIRHKVKWKAETLPDPLRRLTPPLLTSHLQDINEIFQTQMELSATPLLHWWQRI